MISGPLFSNACRAAMHRGPAFLYPRLPEPEASRTTLYVKVTAKKTVPSSFRPPGMLQKHTYGMQLTPSGCISAGKILSSCYYCWSLATAAPRFVLPF